MHPILFKLHLPLIGEFPLHTFGVLVALGSFLSILWIRYEGKRRGFDPEMLMGIAVETLLVGVAGSRILFIIVTPHVFEGKSWFSYVNIREGGLVWYGGMLPAAAYAIWRAWQLKLPWRTVADVIAPSVMLGLAVGRCGCLCAGDDFGKISLDGPHWWTLTFTPFYGPDGKLAPPNEQPLMPEAFWGKPLYPSQPLMGIGALTIFGITAFARKRLAPRPLATTFLMAWLYAIHRFLVESVRGDEVRGFVKDHFPGRDLGAIGELSTSQAIGLPIFLLCFGAFLKIVLSRPKGIEPPPPMEDTKKDEKPPVVEKQQG